LVNGKVVGKSVVSFLTHGLYVCDIFLKLCGLGFSFLSVLATLRSQVRHSTRIHARICLFSVRK